MKLWFLQYIFYLLYYIVIYILLYNKNINYILYYYSIIYYKFYSILRPECDVDLRHWLLFLLWCRPDLVWLHPPSEWQSVQHLRRHYIRWGAGSCFHDFAQLSLQQNATKNASQSTSRSTSNHHSSLRYFTILIERWVKVPESPVNPTTVWPIHL